MGKLRSSRNPFHHLRTWSLSSSSISGVSQSLQNRPECLTCRMGYVHAGHLLAPGLVCFLLDRSWPNNLYSLSCHIVTSQFWYQVIPTIISLSFQWTPVDLWHPRKASPVRTSLNKASVVLDTCLDAYLLATYSIWCYTFLPTLNKDSHWVTRSG